MGTQSTWEFSERTATFDEQPTNQAITNTLTKEERTNNNRTKHNNQSNSNSKHDGPPRTRLLRPYFCGSSQGRCWPELLQEGLPPKCEQDVLAQGRRDRGRRQVRRARRCSGRAQGQAQGGNQGQRHHPELRPGGEEGRDHPARKDDQEGEVLQRLYSHLAYSQRRGQGKYLSGLHRRRAHAGSSKGPRERSKVHHHRLSEAFALSSARKPSPKLCIFLISFSVF